MIVIMLTIMAMLLLPSAVQGQSLCTICPDGGSFNMNKFVPSFNATCLQLEALLSIQKEFCDIASQHAAWCECDGVEPTCTFCPDGMEPLYSDFVIPDTDGKTCGDYVYYASVFGHSNETLCDLFTAFRDLCGGCVDPSPTSSPAPTAVPLTNECSTLCPDGTSAPNPYAIIFMGDGVTYTCGQAEALLAFSNPFGSCEYAWLVGVTRCGCEYVLENATCPLCEDASAVPNLSFEVLPNITCGGLQYLILNGGGIECAPAQATAGVYCGCDNSVVSQNACRICGDRRLPDASWLADPDNQTTCLELEYQANTGEITCTEVQDTWASICCSKDIPLVKPPRAPTIKPSTTTAPSMPTVAPSKTSDAAHVSNNLARLFFAGAFLLLLV